MDIGYQSGTSENDNVALKEGIIQVFGKEIPCSSDVVDKNPFPMPLIIIGIGKYIGEWCIFFR
ncbi:hypothetical protein SDC9_144682 [bioreactor metagenome]|uniref:Uncharacterized protein n=1 Tax=bioreactor metagenome TaxID=1076179 RepID=A0A645E7V5_9ZZZZ